MFKPSHFLGFVSPIIISSVPCLHSLLIGRFNRSRAVSVQPVTDSVGRPVLCAFRGHRSCIWELFAECCVIRALPCLAPEQAKSKHSTLWLKGHLSRGGNPASSPKSINRGGLLSHGAAHCHGNAPSEWAKALILHPPIFAAAF